MLKITVISTFAQFLALASVWNTLLAHSDMDIVYMTHEWFAMYWKLFEKNSDMQILVFEQDGSPVAIAPLMRIKGFWRGIKHTCLTFIANFYSCRTGLINTTDKNIFALALKHFKDSRVKYDMIYANFIPRECATDREIRQVIEAGHHAHRILSGDLSPYIPLDGISTWDGYLNSRNKHFRDNLKRTVKAFEKSGDYTLRSYAGQEEIDTAWEKLIAVSRNTWKFRQGTAIASAPEYLTFFRTFAGMAASNGWLKILLLEYKEEPIAFTLELPYKTTLFFNKTGFDERHARLSPGTYILCKSLQEAIENKSREFDLLGKNEEYKMRFTSHLRSHDKFLIFTDTGLGRLLACYETAVLPALKRMTGLILRHGTPAAPVESTGRPDFAEGVKTGRDACIASETSRPAALANRFLPLKNFIRGISGHIHR